MFILKNFNVFMTFEIFKIVWEKWKNVIEEFQELTDKIFKSKSIDKSITNIWKLHFTIKQRNEQVLDRIVKRFCESLFVQPENESENTFGFGEEKNIEVVMLTYQGKKERKARYWIQYFKKYLARVKNVLFNSFHLSWLLKITNKSLLISL